MSHLAEALKALMHRHACTQTALAERAGVPLPVVNRTLNDHTEVNDENFARLVSALTSDDVEKAEMLAARLRDWCTGPGADRVVIDVTKEVRRDTPVLPSMLRDSIAFLDQLGHRDPEVRELIIDLARCLGHGGKAASAADAVVDDASGQATRRRRTPKTA